MAYKFRTSGPWGPGTSVDLDPVDVDNNFWQSIQDIAAKAVQGVGIADVIVSGNQFSFVLTDHTILGPYDLPMMQIIFRGEWLPNTFYAAGSIITHGNSTYFVEVNHTSEATFDPGANDGHGQDFYGLLLENAGGGLPPGGAVGDTIIKTAPADFAATWGRTALANLTDTTIGQGVNQPPLAGSVLELQDDGTWRDSPNFNLPLEDRGTFNGTFSLDFRYSSTTAFVANAWTAGNIHNTLNGIVWPAPTSPRFMVHYLLVFNASGSDDIVWGVPISWAGGNVPHLTKGLPNSVDLFMFWSADGTTTFGTKLTPGNALLAFKELGGLTATDHTLDLSQSESVTFALADNVNITSILWPPGTFIRRVIQLWNNSNFSLTWSVGVKWPNGVAPVITPGGVPDVIVLHTFDGGTNVYGSVVGQNYI